MENTTKIITKITDKTDFFIQAKDGRIFHICEGTGDNLLQEDIDEGYVDYINYDMFDTLQDVYDQCGDGGMVLLTKLYTDMSVEEILQAVADMEDAEFKGAYTV